MKKFVLLSVLFPAVALIPWTATATATGGSSPGSALDIVHAEMDGSGEFNVWGTLKCAAAGPVNLDVEFETPTTTGPAPSGQGASNHHTCPAPGETIKWVIDAQSNGFNLVVEDPVVITALAAGSTIATKTETKILHWGLPSGAATDPDDD